MGVPLNMGTFGPVGLKRIFYTLTSFIINFSTVEICIAEEFCYFLYIFLHQSVNSTTSQIIYCV